MKSPAFQWYPTDYLGSQRVQMMTLEEEGAYCRLLWSCWQHGSIPSDPELAARLVGKGCSTTVARVVLPMFTPSEDPARLIHDRLELERQKQADWREKSAAGGRKSAEMRKGGSTVVQPPYQPNGNTPTPSSVFPLLPSASSPAEKGKKRFAPPLEEESKLQAAKCGLPEVERQKFMAHYESNGWLVSGRKMVSWQSAMTKWKLNWETNRYGTNSNNRNAGLIGNKPLEEPRAVRILRERALAAQKLAESAQNPVATQVALNGNNPS